MNNYIASTMCKIPHCNETRYRDSMAFCQKHSTVENFTRLNRGEFKDLQSTEKEEEYGVSHQENYHYRELSLKTFLNERLEEAKGGLLRVHTDAAAKSENIFKSTKMIQQYYKFMHRIEVLTELLEEIQ